VSEELKRDLALLAQREKRDLSEYARMVLEAHIAEKKAQARDSKMAKGIAMESRARSIASTRTC
jgi:hypothetical protein